MIAVITKAHVFQVNSSSIVALSKMFELLPSLPLIFKPVVDNFTTDPFLPNDPWTSIESGDFNDVPIIIGANSDEGLFPILRYHQNETFIKETSTNWDKIVAPLIMFHR